MGILLKNQADSGSNWTTPYPDWRTIVEAIIRLEVLPRAVAEKLHHELINSGLSREQARLVAQGLRESVLSELQPGELLYMNGMVVSETEVVLGPMHRNMGWVYNTNSIVLTEFIEFCEECEGFLI